MIRWRGLICCTVAILLLGYLPGCNSPVPEVLPPTPVSTQPERQATSTTQAALPEILIRPSDGTQMVSIPGGSFQMGSTEAEILDAIALCQEHYQTCNRWYYERESPAHPVTLADFWIDQTEITNAQYRQCVAAGICPEPMICDKGEPTYADPQKPDHPVVCVNWEAAQAYCHWAGARLPTEAEWEYAFRGSAGLIYPWGNVFDGSWLNYCDRNCSQVHVDERFEDGFIKTAPVGSFLHDASWSGVLDMSGNVSEWVADWYGDYSLEVMTNPVGPISGSERMLKGCSWFYHPAYCRGAARGSASPDIRFDYLGFRCAAPASTGIIDDIDMTPHTVSVPAANPPTIDGTLSTSEWDSAAVATFADGSELLLMHAGDYLYLGLRANTPGMIVGNVFIQRENEIIILHSSAALGTAIYQQGEGVWHQVRDFDWRCRDSGSSASAQAERAAFLQEESWLASNARMGTPNELEYQIAILEETLRLAVNFIRADDPNVKIPWPTDLADGCILPTPGGLPADLYFSPGGWATLSISP
jgi:formylglycine-generating enzyme required for sulfatase activity